MFIRYDSSMRIVERILSLVAPHICLVCGREGSLMCLWCAPDSYAAVPSRCYRCKRLMRDSSTCSSCKRHAPLRHVWVRTEYDGYAKQLLYLLKFGRAQAAAAIVAKTMAEILPYLPKDTVIVPVPTATSRVRQRGYDQSILCARQVASLTGLRYTQPLTRLTQSRQLGAHRKERLAQLQGAFMVTRPAEIRRKHILLIDDVITTGATLQTAAKLVKTTGAKSVSALVFAQKQ